MPVWSLDWKRNGLLQYRIMLDINSEMGRAHFLQPLDILNIGNCLHLQAIHQVLGIQLHREVLVLQEALMGPSLLGTPSHPFLQLILVCLVGPVGQALHLYQAFPGFLGLLASPATQEYHVLLH
jgi:hypothetical protein